MCATQFSLNFPTVCYVATATVGKLETLPCRISDFYPEKPKRLTPFPPSLQPRVYCNSSRVVFLPHGLSVFYPEPAQHKNTPAITSMNPMDLLNPSRSRHMRTTRTRTGCLTCRRRRVKVSPHAWLINTYLLQCDEGKPHCNACIGLQLQCAGYDKPLVFRDSTADVSKRVIAVEARK